MTNLIRIDCMQTDIDSDNNESNLADYTITQDFTVHRRTVLALASSTLWVEIPFIDLPNINFLRISSDQPISVKLNATAPFTAVGALADITELLVKGSTFRIDIQNASGETANITVEVCK